MLTANSNKNRSVAKNHDESPVLTSKSCTKPAYQSFIPINSIDCVKMQLFDFVYHICEIGKNGVTKFKGATFRTCITEMIVKSIDFV